MQNNYYEVGRLVGLLVREAMFPRIFIADAGRLGEFPYATGLEFEDPMHTNALTAREERRVHVILVKIAATINARRLVLRPFFQDYELVTYNFVALLTLKRYTQHPSLCNHQRSGDFI